MPSYGKHRSNALPLALLVGSITLVGGVGNGFNPGVAGIFAGLNFLLVLVGAALPDIDHQSSIPRRKLSVAGGIVATLAYVTGLFASASYLDELYSNPMVGVGSIVIGMYVGLTLLPSVLSAIGSAFDSFSTHRGFTHTAGFVLLMGVLAYGFFDYSLAEVIPSEGTDSMALLAGLALALGVRKHIVDDGIW
ncbi:metal-dependent hydrolase [Candidatus Halobonum tyrrellensis]|uniref:metal-dependent hydrolase n=1 Tax=Candidatus Halobonum tyrrellensis TaxID=1431545 RepID=UPI0009B5C6C3|nr:metal-dependent hydrolase [Candidatus Halobonum tyrrellensis]